MKTIEGKYNTAIIYTDVIDNNALEQIQTMCDQQFLEGCKIRIMPDVHAGAGCTIGTTMTIKDKVVPNIVGVDIGCGMYTVELGNIDIDFEKLDEICHYIPSGQNVWEGKIESFDLTELRCYRELDNIKRIQKSLGTLGGGNHFIEVDKDNNNNKYLVIHSGSRNLGKQVAEYYQDIAYKLNIGMDELFKKKKELIESYKSQGRKNEIQAALTKLNNEFKRKESSIPKDLCYLYDSYLEDYLHDIVICQKYAKRNRELMAQIIIDKMNWEIKSSFQTIHNYIDVDEMILRKGSISAHKGEKVLIPVNMRDGSIIALGKGNPEWNYSAPHGAGRLLSRTEAKEMITLEEYEESMKGIFTTSVSNLTIDESPMAYKSLDDILDFVKDSVDIVEIIKPIYNFKAN